MSNQSITSYGSLIVGWRLHGRHVLILGGNQIAANRLRFALDAKPGKITLITPRANLTSPKLIEYVDHGDITYIDRDFQESDLDADKEPIDLIFSATNNSLLSKKIAAAAKERRIPVNIAEIPNLCDFLLMPIYKDEHFQLAITANSNNGVSYHLTTKLRQHILDTLPNQKDVAAAVNNIALLKENLNDTAVTLSKITDTLPLTKLAQLSEADIKKLVAEHSDGLDVDEEFEKASTSSSLDEKKSDVTLIEEGNANTLTIRSKIRSDYLHDTSAGGPQLVDGKIASAHVAYALSNTCFVYPTTRSSYVGQAAEQWSAQNLENIFGFASQVIRMDTRSGAAMAVLGAASSSPSSQPLIQQPFFHGQTTVFTTSQAMVNMIPNLYRIAYQTIPLVVHVAAQGNDENMHNVTNYLDIFNASESGFTILNSFSVQETHDISLIAHLTSLVTNTPIMHTFDGLRTAHELSKIELLSFKEIGRILREILSDTTILSSAFDKLNVIESIANRMRKLTGRQYKLFEYVGAHDAESVLIVMGGETAIVKQIVGRLSHDGQKVGVIIVRVYRPWSDKHFLAAVPKSTKNIAVLEQASPTQSHSSSLFSDVAASFQLGSWQGSKPSIVDVKYPLSQLFDAQTVKKILNQLASGSNIDLNGEILSTTEISPVLSNVKQCIFWDTESVGSAHSTKHIISLLSLDPNLNSSSLSTHDIYNNGGVVTTNLRFSTNGVPDVYDDEAGAGYIAIHDASLTAKYDILTAAKENAIVLLNTSWTPDELETKLPSDFRFELANKNIQLYLIDAAKIILESGLNPEAIDVVFQAAFFILFYNTKSINRVQDSIAKFFDGINEKEVTSAVNSIFGQTEKELLRVEISPTWLPLGRSDQKLATSIDNNSFGPNLDSPVTRVAKVGSWHTAALNLLFKEAYGTTQATRPDLAERTSIIRVTENRRLTPSTYDRYLFHIEFDLTGVDLKYSLGEALGVYAHNDPVEVNQFLEYYQLNPNDVVSIPGKEGKNYETRTVLQLFSQVIDVFGRPSKRFYESLASYATDQSEREKLLRIASPDGAEEFKRRVDDTITYAELFYEFPSARPPVQDLVQLIAPIKPRHYSIASAQSVHPNSVHLLVVTVEWDTSKGKKRFGQCTRYLSNLKVGEEVTVSIKPSVMKLPPLDTQPVIMAGLGTGMAPFRAFIEERAYRKSQGMEVGPMILYFGSRNRAMEYLYGEELEAYHDEGLLTYLRLAFSRDQPHKVYIQHKMQEDSHLLHDYLLNKEGWFYLCGPTWPVPDVRDAITNSFVTAGGLTVGEANNWVTKLKDLERYILEVY